VNGILLLDASYRPLRVIPVRRAVGLMLAGKAEGVAEETIEMRHADSSLTVPVILRLAYSVTIPFKRDFVQCTRRGILARDNYECQFITAQGPCDQVADTMDHVIPKAKGGEKLSWTNLVAACSTHNHKKADRSLEAMGWKLKREPFAPRAQMRVVGKTTHIPEEWAFYLQPA
jgi:hypothetical protein